MDVLEDVAADMVDVMIISYETMVSQLRTIKSLRWELVVFDEVGSKS